MDDLVARFDLGRVQPSGAIFDLARLDWLNGQWIRRLPSEELTERALPFLAEALAAESAEGHTTRRPTADDLAPLLPMVVERLPRLDAIGPMLDFVFVEDLAVEPALLIPKRWDAATTAEALEAASRVIETGGPVSFEADELEPPLRGLCEAQGWKVGDLFMAIRVAVTGRTATPPLFDTMMAIGYERTLGRLQAAEESLRAGGGEELEGRAR
jgi:glutamyl-tRNA synthetase